MATRSYIAYSPGENNDKVIYIYCHWDGYPGSVGKILVNHYDSKEIVEELIMNGELSSLGETVDTCVKSDKPRIYLSDSFQDLIEKNPMGVDYFYLFTEDKTWVCYDIHFNYKVIP